MTITSAEALERARQHLYGDRPRDGTVPQQEKQGMDVQQKNKLRDLVAEIEDIDRQLNELRTQKSEVMRRAVDQEFDRKALRRVLALRKMEDDARRQHRDLVDEYLHALDALPLEAAIETAKTEEGDGEGRPETGLAPIARLPRARGRRAPVGLN